MGGINDSSRYPDDWDTRRRQIYKRDAYECQECGAMGGQFGDTELHCHHRTPISQGGSHEPENLVTLCRDCHNKKHDHPIGDTWNRNDESIPTPKDDSPPSDQVINQDGETLGEFAQRFNQTKSQASEPLSIPDSRTYSGEQSSRQIPEDSDGPEQSDNAIAETDAETKQTGVKLSTFLANQVVQLLVGIIVASLVVFIASPRFEIASWRSVILIGLILYVLYPNSSNK